MYPVPNDMEAPFMRIVRLEKFKIQSGRGLGWSVNPWLAYYRTYKSQNLAAIWILGKALINFGLTSMKNSNSQLGIHGLKWFRPFEVCETSSRILGKVYISFANDSLWLRISCNCYNNQKGKSVEFRVYQTSWSIDPWSHLNLRYERCLWED